MTHSKITLGTAQLGLNYGIANKTGKPDIERAYEILSLAQQSGINCIDTAMSYGDSEVVIGKYLEQNSAWRPNIITKLKIDVKDKNKLREKVNANIEQSVERLRQDNIYCIMLHDFFDLISYGEKLMEILLDIKSKGKVLKIGVSVYSDQELAKALEYPELEIFQGPVNVFDQRIVHSGLLNDIKAQGKEFFARSVFLQGLFFLEGKKFFERILEALFYINKLSKLASEYNLSVPEIAFSYVKDNPKIHSLVLGIEIKKQLEDNVKLLNVMKLPRELKNEITEIFLNIPEKVRDPRLWSK